MQSPTKKLVNELDSCVSENLSGYLRIHSGLRQLTDPRIVVRSDLDELQKQNKVLILTGGGSGHEPAFAGFVGRGMATAAVQGAIFASPPSSPILKALRTLGANHTAGVLIVINDYTGDRLNFGLALERAVHEGIRVQILYNADDCALIPGSKKIGRRGLAGCVLVLKILGAMAEEGKSLDEIVATGRQVVGQLGTLGCCLAPCSIPGQPPMFTMESNTIEIGLGLHGESGVESVKIQSAHNVVSLMLDHMTTPDNPHHVELPPGGAVTVLMNNLGSTSEMEMNILVYEVMQQLEKKAVSVERIYMNRFITSMEMAGFSITLLAVDKDLLHWLDARCEAGAWVCPYIGAEMSTRHKVNMTIPVTEPEVSTQSASPVQTLDTGVTDLVTSSIQAACLALVQSEERLNHLDAQSGDGDCGTAHRQGAQAILDALTRKELSVNLPSVLASEVSAILESSMGGTSGALYSLFFTSVRQPLSECSYRPGSSGVVKALQEGLKCLMNYSGTVPGDRSLIDPLHAAVEYFQSISNPSVEDFITAFQAAEESANMTASMEAKVGRSSRVRDELVKDPDPGAIALVIWLKAALSAFL